MASITREPQLKSWHLASTYKIILSPLMVQEGQGEGETHCISTWLFLGKKKKKLWWANLELEALFLCCPAAAFESCVCVTDNCHGSVSFHLFIIHIPPTSKDKCKAGKGSFFIFVHQVHISAALFCWYVSVKITALLQPPVQRARRHWLL